MDLYNNSDPINNTNEIGFNTILSNTFFRMFLGLLASAIAALYAYYSGAYIKMITSGMYITLTIIELIVVIVFSLAFRKLSSTTVSVLYFAYAFLNGFTLSVIFAAYELSSIGITFLATSLIFGALSYIGAKTEKDISNWGTILSVVLIVGLILTIINLFIGNTLLDIVLDWVLLFVFFGVTIYDINTIKSMQGIGICDDEKLYVYGAMQLYLDFINIFLRILSIFGNRRD